LVRLGMVKSDTPQRDYNTCHLGVGAGEACNKCPCRRKEVWDVDFDLTNLRYRVGIHDAVLKAKDTLSPGAFEVLLFHCFSFHCFSFYLP
jgi:hypothetical protein